MIDRKLSLDTNTDNCKLINLDTGEEVTDFGANRKGTLQIWDDACDEVAEALGDCSDEYNLDWIVGDCFARAAYIDENGTQHGLSMYVRVVDDVKFWESVELHTL
ncbi:MAG: hypothetical protein Q3982_05105 [Phoenicibacter congonensis]|uniref:Uncharacterized protein n=1 Tax=Phoenicibacter congonensis TaxID=1944646 RepID=A0AA43UB62_9ACTN|nr:hypothetical protein [Phoenicibacter congonensis]